MSLDSILPSMLVPFKVMTTDVPCTQSITRGDRISKSTKDKEKKEHEMREMREMRERRERERRAEEEKKNDILLQEEPPSGKTVTTTSSHTPSESLPVEESMRVFLQRYCVPDPAAFCSLGLLRSAYLSSPEHWIQGLNPASVRYDVFIYWLTRIGFVTSGAEMDTSNAVVLGLRLEKWPSPDVRTDHIPDGYGVRFILRPCFAYRHRYT